VDLDQMRAVLCEIVKSGTEIKTSGFIKDKDFLD
jgi:hypothetical protein